jgi:hypothetical protein
VRKLSGSVALSALGVSVAFGLVLAIAGCGETVDKKTEATGVPSNVQESNKNMENFMKSQTPKKK